MAYEFFKRDLNDVRDETILAFAPALRRRLAMPPAPPPLPPRSNGDGGAGDGGAVDAIGDVDAAARAAAAPQRALWYSPPPKGYLVEPDAQCAARRVALRAPSAPLSLPAGVAPPALPRYRGARRARSGRG